MIGFSLVGMGNYTVTNYSFQGKTRKTQYFPIAFNEFYHPDKHFLLMTKEAEEKNLNNLREIYPSFEVIEIPFGKSEDEFWEIFRLISENINYNEEICFDITHGFRSQPVIAIACLIFLRSSKNIKIKDIIYGAFEARDELNNSPVFSLLPFMDLLDWSNAVNNMINFGNAKSLQNIYREIHRDTYLEKNDNPAKSLFHLGNTLEKISVDFSTLRVKDFKKDLESLSRVIKSYFENDKNLPEAYPSKILLDRLKSIFGNIAITDFESPENIITLINIIEFLIDTSQYQQAITLMRELIISYLIFLNGKDIINDRDKIEEAINNLSLAKQEHKILEYSNCGFIIPEDLINIWMYIIELRNDINHASYRINSLPGLTIINNTKEYFTNLKDFIINNPINKNTIPNAD